MVIISTRAAEQIAKYTHTLGLLNTIKSNSLRIARMVSLTTVAIGCLAVDIRH